MISISNSAIKAIKSDKAISQQADSAQLVENYKEQFPINSTFNGTYNKCLEHFHKRVQGKVGTISYRMICWENFPTQKENCIELAKKWSATFQKRLEFATKIVVILFNMKSRIIKFIVKEREIPDSNDTSNVVSTTEIKDQNITVTIDKNINNSIVEKTIPSQQIKQKQKIHENIQANIHEKIDLKLVSKLDSKLVSKLDSSIKQFIQSIKNDISQEIKNEIIHEFKNEFIQEINGFKQEFIQEIKYEIAANINKFNSIKSTNTNNSTNSTNSFEKFDSMSKSKSCRPVYDESRYNNSIYAFRGNNRIAAKASTTLSQQHNSSKTYRDACIKINQEE